MSLKIASQNDLTVERNINLSAKKNQEMESPGSSGNNGLKVEPEASLSISNEGKMLFDENGRYGKWLSDEELRSMFGEEEIAIEEEMKFQYGYDKELDSISGSFKDAFSEFKIGKYAGTGIDYKNIDYNVVDQMSETYGTLKQEIESSYAGDEKESRLAELDKAYEKVFQDNIINPIKAQIDSSMSFYNTGGTLVSISGSQDFIDSYYANNEEMKGTYNLLKKVSDRLSDFSAGGISQWIDNSKGVKNSLSSIVSSFINITGI